MGRLGTFVPRLVALTAVWLLATTALTYAAAHRATTPVVTPVTTTAATPTVVLVVPDVRHQAYVFAKGTLGDAGFAWRIAGGIKGYPSNTVTSQTPAPGTRVVDTGAPLVVLRLERTAGKEVGVPAQESSIRGTPVRLADLAVAAAPTAPARTSLPTAKAPVAQQKTALPAGPAPRKRSPALRPPSFVVAGGRREPLDEIPLTRRANALLHWIAQGQKPTDANVKYWLYQHAWIVTGAKMGWWHGAAALETLQAVDRRVWNAWGIGASSKAQAERALAFVQAREAK